MARWLRQEWRLVVECGGALFAGFCRLAFVRAANPEILGTEKPMELAFINAILRSPTFPPHDPWLSGYAISYYYFGYVIVAMLAAGWHGRRRGFQPGRLAGFCFERRGRLWRGA